MLGKCFSRNICGQNLLENHSEQNGPFEAYKLIFNIKTIDNFLNKKIQCIYLTDLEQLLCAVKVSAKDEKKRVSLCFLSGLVVAAETKWEKTGITKTWRE